MQDGRWSYVPDHHDPLAIRQAHRLPIHSAREGLPKVPVAHDRNPVHACAYVSTSAYMRTRVCVRVNIRVHAYTRVRACQHPRTCVDADSIEHCLPLHFNVYTPRTCVETPRLDRAHASWGLRPTCKQDYHLFALPLVCRHAPTMTDGPRACVQA